MAVDYLANLAGDFGRGLRHLDAAGQVLDFPDALSELIRSSDQGHAKSAPLGVLKLRTYLLGLEEDLDPKTFGSQGPCHLLIIPEAFSTELYKQHRCRRR